MSPIYTYYCESCKNSQEELFSISARPDAINCKSCNSPSHFQIASSHFIVNGASAANRYSGDSNFKFMGVPGSEK